MGKRGPAPTPTNLKLLNGNTSRINRNEPKPQHADTAPPEWLADDRARTTYSEMAEKLIAMNVFTDADKHALAQLSMYWVSFKDLADTMTTEVWETESGYKSTDPRINSMVKLGEKVTKLLQQFGMTPASRTGVQVVDGAAKDPLEEYLNGVN